MLDGDDMPIEEFLAAIEAWPHKDSDASQENLKNN